MADEPTKTTRKRKAKSDPEADAPVVAPVAATPDEPKPKAPRTRKAAPKAAPAVAETPAEPKPKRARKTKPKAEAAPAVAETPEEPKPKPARKGKAKVAPAPVVVAAPEERKGKGARKRKAKAVLAPDVDGVEAPEPAPVEAIPVPEDARWYVLHTYSGYENKVKQNLEHRIESMGMLEQIFQVVVPVEEEVDIKDGQRRIVERKIFPGYVLVHMLLTDESWSVVRNTPAVTGFVGSGTDAADRLRPTPLRSDDVDKILRRMEAEEPTIRVSFRPGQNVRIVDGPFTDFHGVVDSIDLERGKVRLMVNFFGRETPVELDFLQVEKV